MILRVLLVAGGAAAMGLLALPLRRHAKRLFAPPHGRRVAAVVWSGAAFAMVVSLSQAPRNGVVGLTIFLTAPLVALLWTFAVRDETNLALGRPADHVDVPARFGRGRRLWFGLLALGAVAAAPGLLLLAGGNGLHGAWLLGSSAIAFAAAALTGRSSARLRHTLGATAPAASEELPAPRDRAG